MVALSRVAAVFTLVVWAGTASAQSLDTGFQPNVDNVIHALVVQPDGKFVLAGEFSDVNGNSRAYIARLLSNGIVDTTFDPGIGPNGIVRALALQPDGKILIGGDFTAVSMTGRNRIARLNADGSLDTSFTPGSGADNPVYGIALQPDGRVIAVGSFSMFDGANRSRIVRLVSTGALDNSFNPGAGATNTLYAVGLFADGKIAIGGAHSHYDGLAMPYVSRVNADGSLDTGYGGGSSPDAQVRCLAVQADGKLVIGGDFTTLGTQGCSRLGRLLANGTRDTAFTIFGPNGPAHCICVLPDRRLVIGGAFASFQSTPRANLVGTDELGGIDPNFVVGSGASAAVNAVAVTADQRLVVGGAFTVVAGSARFRVARMNTTGMLDAGMATGSVALAGVSAAVPQPDLKLLLAGTFIQLHGTTRFRMGRLLANGALDTSFTMGTDSVGGYPNAMAVLPDARIIVVGSFTSLGGVARNRITRVNTDGTVDWTFNPGSGAGGPLYAVSLQPDGKILVGGTFGVFDGATRNNIARLQAGGALDTAFNPDADGAVYSMAVLPDGKILIAGTFANVGGTSRARVARLNADGTLDTSFDPGAGPNGDLDAIAVQPDGRVVIAGAFNSVDGTTRNGIARLNYDGSLDTSFDAGAGPGAKVWSMAIQSDGKILVAGQFGTLAGGTRNRVGRLQADGSLDASFDAGAGPNGDVLSAALQPDGAIVLGGNFTQVGAVPALSLARLTNTEGVLQQLSLVGSTVRWKPQGTMPAPMRVTFQLSAGGQVEGTFSGTDWRANLPTFPSGWVTVTARAYVAAGQNNGSVYTVGTTRGFYVQTPVVSLSATIPGYTENDPPMVLDSTATVTDPNNATFENGLLTVFFTANGAAEDELTVSTTADARLVGADVEYDATGAFAGGQSVVGTVPASGTGSGAAGQALTITFNGASTPAIVQAVLRAVAYSNASDNPSTLARTLRVVVWDGDGGQSNFLTRTLNIAAVNDAPTLTSVSTLTGASEDTQFVIPFADLLAAADEADVDSATLSFRVEGVASGTLTINGGTVTVGTTLVATGDQLEWTPDADANGNVAAFSVVAWDGSLASSTPVTVLSAVTAVNDAPAVTAPPSANTASGAAVTFSGTILIQDTDAGTGTMEVALSATSGTLSLASTTGLTIVAGADGSTTVTVQGSMSDLNSALNGLQYLPNSGFSGSDSIQIQVSDLGSTGGGALTDAATISVQVAPGSGGTGGSGGGDDDDSGCAVAKPRTSGLILVALLAWAWARRRRSCLE